MESPPSRRPVLLCLVVGTARSYGVGKVWDEVLNGLTARGWKVVIAVLEAEHTAAWQSAYPDFVVASAPWSRELPRAAHGRWHRIATMALRVKRQLAHVGWLTKLAREVRASTVMIQSPPEVVLAALLSRRTGARALWLVPNVIGTEVPFGLNRLAYRLVLRLGKVAAASNSHFTDASFGPGRHERHVVHLGVDTTYFAPGGDPRSVREAFGIPMDAPVLGLFARMTPSKGQDRLVEALAQSGTPFHVLLCGGPLEGDYGDDLRRRIDELGLAGRVHLAGPQTDLRPFFAASDIIASLYLHAEGFGLTVAEAMACGKPVLVHGLGGPAEIVTDGREGWVLADVEIASLAQGLRRAIASRGDWGTLGRAGHERARRAFGNDRFLREVDRLARRER